MPCRQFLSIEINGLRVEKMYLKLAQEIQVLALYFRPQLPAESADCSAAPLA
jgi:hypothetical protein